MSMSVAPIYFFFSWQFRRILYAPEGMTLIFAHVHHFSCHLSWFIKLFFFFSFKSFCYSYAILGTSRVMANFQSIHHLWFGFLSLILLFPAVILNNLTHLKEGRVSNYVPEYTSPCSTHTCLYHRTQYGPLGNYNPQNTTYIPSFRLPISQSTVGTVCLALRDSAPFNLPTCTTLITAHLFIIFPLLVRIFIIGLLPVVIWLVLHLAS